MKGGKRERGVKREKRREEGELERFSKKRIGVVLNLLHTLLSPSLSLSLSLLFSLSIFLSPSLSHREGVLRRYAQPL